MPYTNYSPEEVARKGEEVYERSIRRLVEDGNSGKFVAIDVERGEYEMDEDDLRATQRLLAKHPDAIVFGLRVGYPTAYTLGSHMETGSR